ncbi:MAG: tetratricopeptide repeat protein [Proteobacteria bacterium]|nr:tetratricopeptide repeat protein [Pseudomonadota bacterium]
MYITKSVNRSNCKLFNILILYFTLITTSNLAMAQSSDLQEKMMNIAEEGIQLFQAEKYTEAIAKFEQAYAIIPDANILFNIARCYQLLGDKSVAIEYFNRFIYHPDVSEDAKERAKGHLKPLQESKKQEEANPYDDENIIVTSNSNIDVSQKPIEAVKKPRRRIPEWSLVGSGGAALIVGGIFSGLALNTHSKFESTNVLDKKEELEDKGKTQALVGDLCLGAGAALAATGLILFIVLDGDRERSSDAQSVAYSPFLVRNGGGLKFVLRY